MDIANSTLKETGLEKLLFKKAETEAQNQEIYRSRLKICKEEFPYILNFDSEFPGKDQYDDYSTLFYATVNNKIVASCRITPFFNNVWEISKNLPGNFKLNLNTKNTVQLNRVYLDKEYRNQSLHEFMFYHFSEWVLENTQYTEYFAICNAGLVRLYKKIGAVLGQEEGFRLNGRGPHLYYFVKGSIREFNNIIKYLNNGTSNH